MLLRQVQPRRLVGSLSWSEKIADVAAGVVVLWGLTKFVLGFVFFRSKCMRTSLEKHDVSRLS